MNKKKKKKRNTHRTEKLCKYSSFNSSQIEELHDVQKEGYSKKHDGKKVFPRTQLNSGPS